MCQVSWGVSRTTLTNKNEIAKNIGILYEARPYLDKRALLCLYYFLLKYVSAAWCSTKRTYLKKL